MAAYARPYPLPCYMNTTTSSRLALFGRLLSIPVLLCGAAVAAIGATAGRLPLVLLGCALLFGGVFGLRHNLFDLSPQALDPSALGKRWLAVLVVSGALILSALVLAIVS